MTTSGVEAVWNGTEAELDALMEALHSRTTCIACLLEPSECCLGASSGDCPGHSLLVDQRAMDYWLHMRRIWDSQDAEAFHGGSGNWWSVNPPELAMAP